MTSERKIAANRLNARNSTGPRTARGKSRASGNAWRHGWAVAKTGHSTVSADVERMAKAICGDHASPALYEQAVIIVECEIVLLSLRAAWVAAIKRNSIVGRKLERPNQQSCFSANELTLALEALAGGELRPANAEIRAKEYNRADREESFPRPGSCPDPSAQRSDEDQPATQVRDEVDAFQHALPEVVSLERYERRALSRRNRAIRMLEAISIAAPFLDRKAKDTQ